MTRKFHAHQVVDLAPDFGQKYSAYAVEQTRKAGATDAQIEAKRKELARYFEEYKKPLVRIAYTFLEPLPVGILVTLITAAALSRKRRITAGERLPSSAA